MADESLNLRESVAELEEIELEEIEDSADVTGEFARPGAQSSAGRISSPPPVPAAARERRASTPPGLAPPPAAGTTVPPAPPAGTMPSSSSSASTVRPPPPRSGMFLIDAARKLPPLPGGDASQPAQPPSELRELRALNDRLRLTLRLREDRIRELETMLREQRARADALEAELTQVRAQQPAQPQGDDLKRIPGIGPGFERALHDNGITTFRQIADWTPEDVDRIARQLRTAPARILRGRWIERARELAGES